MLSAQTNLNSWLKVSQLEILITTACSSSQPAPNYAQHLQVADYINTKKANTPRDAAMLIARLANHRDAHIAVLALDLLDTLVQSCGYPFHLQISTKEFLNELVRRFPERPPPFIGPAMYRILDLIHGWKEGICVTSRWKDDLGNIRDMHRLLTFKGYRFRDLSRQSTIVDNMTIKSADELENEDREAQSAKLQELIRRGTPRDLAAAQELMKTLAGADPETKPDYRSQAMSELEKLQSKVVLLTEMLDNVDTARGERFAAGDAYDQVASILESARPKLQKWISDAETEEPESLDTFLQINDQINTVIARFEAFKRGDYAASSNPIPAELAPDASSSAHASLIDFDDSDNGMSGGSTAKNDVDELADLFGAAGLSQPQHQQQQAVYAHPSRVTQAITSFSPPYSTSTTSPPSYTPFTSSTAAPAPSIPLYAPSPVNGPPPVNSASRPISMSAPASRVTSAGGAGTQSRRSPQVMGAIMLPGTPTPGGQQQVKVIPPGPFGGASFGSTQTPVQQTQGNLKDPFADLTGLF